MKIWIPGGKGMLGTDLAVEARSRGHEVVLTDKEVDIADASAVAELMAREKPTHIINCAAHTGVDACETEEPLALRINAEGPARLGEAAHKAGAHAIQISTDYVFPGDATRPYLEEDETGPLGAYGRTKLEGEKRFLEATQGFGAVVRTSWLYGVHGKSFPATMLKLFAEKESMKVVNDQLGRTTYTKDLARALADVATRKLAGTWHFANSGEVTWHAFAEAIRQQAIARGLPVKVQTIEGIPTSAYPTPAKRPAYSVLSTSKIEKALGWSPRSWQDALTQFLTDRAA
jgi:dTDP-4-dehydrorhamnose reductase